MRRLIIGSLCAALTALGACGRAAAPARRPEAARAAAPTIPVAPVSAEWLDSVAGHYAAEEHLVGLSVAVAQDGKVTFAQGYGYSSLADKAPVTTQTMFAVGSVTKEFTCTAALMLQDSGKLSMQDPVAKWFPNLTRAADITLIDLGNHVSGYRDYYPLDFVDREMQRPTTPDSVIQEYATRPLDFEPGTRWSYSNTNFDILGRVVEKVSGEAFGDFLARHVFGRVNMPYSRYAPSPGNWMATGYTSFALGAPERAEPEAAGWDGMAGAIWSTPGDLAAWDLALMEGKLLSPRSYQMLTGARRLSDGRSTGYGCGLSVNDRGNAIVLSHGGAVSGFSALNAFVPATRSAVALLTNQDFGDLGPLANVIVRKLIPQMSVPAITGPPPLAAAQAFLAGFQRGQVDRATLGDDFSAYLPPERLAAARRSMAGRITDLAVGGTSERGGMEVADLSFKVGGRPATALMYRTPDGKIQEFLVYRP